MIDEWRRAGDDAPLFRFLERNPDLERADIAVDLVGLDRGAGGRHAADRDRGDAGRAPALLSADPLADPVGQRAHRGDAELLSFQVVHRLDRRVVADHHRHVARHAGHDTDRLGRHALHHERHAGPAADADVDRVGGQALLEPCVAVERRGFDLDAVLGEDAHLDADVERREGPGERHCFANAQLLGRARGRDQRQREDRGGGTRNGTQNAGHGVLPMAADSSALERNHCRKPPLSPCGAHACCLRDRAAAASPASH